MEQVNGGPATAVATRSVSLFERIALSVLGRIDRGFLHITLPDGSKITAGDRSSSMRGSMRIVREDFFRKGVLFADIGFGESYVDGDWETEDLTGLLRLLLANIDALTFFSGSRGYFAPVNLFKFANRIVHTMRGNSLLQSRRNVRDHYDLPAEFFALFLDRTMTYSSARFSDADMSLEEAQAEKYDRLCRAMKLRSGDRVLELGCGWGGFAEHAAREYGCAVTGLTISREQFAFVQKRLEREKLASQVEVRLEDYREVQGEYDKIVSIEMLEAVGHRYLRTFFRKCHELLVDDGVLGLEVIVCPDSRYDQLRKGVDWIQKHIFPGSLIPSIKAINDAVAATGDLYLHDLDEFGMDYARTLGLWRRALNEKLDRLRTLGFDEQFIRKWNYYLSYCEVGFELRNLNVVQMIYARPNNLRFR